MNSTQVCRVYFRSLNGAAVVQLYALLPCRLCGKTHLRNVDFLGFITFDPASRNTIAQCFDARIADIFDGEVYRFHHSLHVTNPSEYDKLCVWSQKQFCKFCADLVNTDCLSAESPRYQTIAEFK